MSGVPPNTMAVTRRRRMTLQAEVVFRWVPASQVRATGAQLKSFISRPQTKRIVLRTEEEHSLLQTMASTLRRHLITRESHEAFARPYVTAKADHCDLQFGALLIARRGRLC